jgi:hypothetical protein
MFFVAVFIFVNVFASVVYKTTINEKIIFMKFVLYGIVMILITLGVIGVFVSLF